VRGFVTKSLTEGSNGAVHMTFGELRHWHKAVLPQHFLTGDDETTKMVGRSFGHSEDVGGVLNRITAEVTRTGTAASFEAFRSHAERVHKLYSLGKIKTSHALETWNGDGTLDSRTCTTPSSRVAVDSLRRWRRPADHCFAI
jgi:hypothetical protein